MIDLEKEHALDTRSALIFEVQQGLLARPKSLAPWMFYDELGSKLFERITELPDYYLTRVERNILADHARAIITEVLAGGKPSLRIVELGAGTASKTRTLLEAAIHGHAEVLYVPVDVSGDALIVAHQSIRFAFPQVRVTPLLANYVTAPPQLEEFDGVTLVLYLGSSIGNFSPEKARGILSSFIHQLKARDALVIGTDFIKDESLLVAAYDDKAGITAAFNVNLLRRLNRELHADFDLDCFRHRACWNKCESRIEMHLESTRAQRVFVAAADLETDFLTSETIHTENSYKFSDESLRALLLDSCFEIETTWKDKSDWYGVTLARPCQLTARV